MFHREISTSGRGARRAPAHVRLTVVVLATSVAFAAGCRRGAPRPSYIDLIHLLPGAEKRSALPADQAFELADADVGGDIKPSIRTCGASRIIWVVRLPDNPVLRTAIAVDRAHSAGLASIAFRIGMGTRRYEGLFRREFRPDDRTRSWQPVSIDLRAYHGWQWSLFYRPSSMSWPIMFSLDTAVSPDGRTECGFWAVPRIEAGS